MEEQQVDNEEVLMEYMQEKLIEIPESFTNKKTFRFSPVYKHFDEITGDIKKLKCLHCPAVLGINTSSLSRHLARNHKSHYEEFLRETAEAGRVRLIKAKNKGQRNSDEDSNISSRIPPKKRVRSRHSSVHNYFTIDSGDSTKSICNYCEKRFVINTTTLTRHLRRAHREQHEELSQLQNAKNTSGATENDHSMVSDTDEHSDVGSESGLRLFESIVKNMRQQLSENRLNSSVGFLNSSESLSPHPSPEKTPTRTSRRINPIAEVFVKTGDSSPSDSEEGYEIESNEIPHLSHNEINQRQLDQMQSQILSIQKTQLLFQTSVNAKLNHLEQMIQILVKTTCPNAMTTKPEQRATAEDKAKNFKLQFDSRISKNGFSFPLSDLKSVKEWNVKLARNQSYRSEVVRNVQNKCDLSSLQGRTTIMIKKLMFYIFEPSVLTKFSWAGLKVEARRGKQKEPFRKLTGVIDLIGGILNDGVSKNDLIGEEEIVKGIKDAVKRAPRMMKQTDIRNKDLPRSDSPNETVIIKQEYEYEDGGSECREEYLEDA